MTGFTHDPGLTVAPSLNGHRSARVMQILVIVLAAAVLLVVGALIERAWFRDRAWSPLGSYPVQKVAQRMVLPSEPVIVSGRKCNATKSPVTVTGRIQIQSVYPMGTIILVGSGVAIRMPGCATFRYANPIPQVVRSRAAEVCRSTRSPSQWKFTGVETPTRDSGTGVPKPWQTESFTIACG